MIRVTAALNDGTMRHAYETASSFSGTRFFKERSGTGRNKPGESRPLPEPLQATSKVAPVMVSRVEGEAVGTGTDYRTYELDVSEPLFRLATECIHFVSNDLRTLATVGTIVAVRAARASEGFPGLAPEAVLGHLDTLATVGAIPVAIQIAPSTADHLEAARALLQARLERSTSLADAVSVLLFDLTVEHAATSMLDRILGDDTREETGDNRSPTAVSGENVVPIR